MMDSDGQSRRDGADLQAFFGRHLVVLHLALDHPGLKRQHVFCSGFILEVRGVWFWITAGHVLKDVEKFLAATGSVAASFLLDIQPKHTGPIPFGFAGAPKAHLFVEGKWDIGWIAIRDLYRTALEANGVIPVSEREIVASDVVADAYVMIGVPAEFTHADEQDDSTKLEFTPTVLHLQRLEDEPPSGGYARMRFDVQGNDILSEQGKAWTSVVGMSGGPIFAAKVVAARVRYWGVAVQSSWLPASRTTFACPLIDVAYALSSAMDSMDSEA